MRWKQAIIGLTALATTACATNPKVIFNPADPPTNQIDEYLLHNLERWGIKTVKHSKLPPKNNIEFADRENYNEIPNIFKQYYGLDDITRTLYLMEELAATRVSLDRMENQQRTLRNDYQATQQALNREQQKNPEIRTITKEIPVYIREQATGPELPEHILIMRIGDNYFTIPDIDLLCKKQERNTNICLEVEKIKQH